MCPVPLVASGFDCHVSNRDFLLAEQNRKGPCADTDKDQDRNNCPRNLDGCVVGKGRRLRVTLGVIAERNPKDQTGHKQCDDCNDYQNHSVQPLQISSKLGHAGLEAHFAVDGGADDLETLWINALRPYGNACEGSQ